MTSVNQVGLVESRAAFDCIRDEWNDLVSRTTDPFFYRHEFFSTWLDHFAAGNKLFIMTLRDQRGRLSAVLPMLRTLSFLRGMPIRQLRSAANLHSGRYDLIADDPARAGPAMFRHLAGNSDWDALVLTDVPRGGRAGWLIEAALESGYPTGRWTATHSPYITLPASWNELHGRLSPRFRANLRRRARRLASRGRVEFRRVVDAPELVAAGMQLELAGWKGRAGTAMAQDKATKNFYIALARQLVRHHCLTFWTLHLDDQLLAFQYGVEQQGCYALLKPVYNEEFSCYSPGQLLMAEVLRDAIARGLTCFDFLGDNMPWKQDWHPQLQAQEWLYVFRNNFYGHLLHAAKFRVRRPVPRTERLS
ncbi:MAG: GNAT family N-acetyltransferase [Wenzhouxiangella sp.]